MCVGHADGRVQLVSREGLSLADIARHEAPVTGIAVHPYGTLAAVSCAGCLLTVHRLAFATVHGLYQDLYASRHALCPHPHQPDLFCVPIA
jgi:hypothetical protein